METQEIKRLLLHINSIWVENCFLQNNPMWIPNKPLPCTILLEIISSDLYYRYGQFRWKNIDQPTTIKSFDLFTKLFSRNGIFVDCKNLVNQTYLISHSNRENQRQTEEVTEKNTQKFKWINMWHWILIYILKLDINEFCGAKKSNFVHTLRLNKWDYFFYYSSIFCLSVHPASAIVALCASTLPSLIHLSTPIASMWLELMVTNPDLSILRGDRSERVNCSYSTIMGYN